MEGGRSPVDQETNGRPEEEDRFGVHFHTQLRHHNTDGLAEIILSIEME
jgi:hypothetical protein